MSGTHVIGVSSDHTPHLWRIRVTHRWAGVAPPAAAVSATLDKLERELRECVDAAAREVVVDLGHGPGLKLEERHVVLLRALAPRIVELCVPSGARYPYDTPHPHCVHLHTEIEHVYEAFKTGNFPAVAAVTTYGVLGVTQDAKDYAQVLFCDRTVRLERLCLAAHGDNRRWLRAVHEAGPKAPRSIVIALDDRYGNNDFWKAEDAADFIYHYQRAAPQHGMTLTVVGAGRDQIPALSAADLGTCAGCVRVAHDEYVIPPRD